MFRSYFGLTIILILLIGFVSCKKAEKQQLSISSPDKEIEVKFYLDDQGSPHYEALFKDQQIIEPSKLGFTFKNLVPFEQLKIESSQTVAHNETWEQPWGEQRFVKNHYNQLVITLTEKQTDKPALQIFFRVFNDGLAFRYRFLNNSEQTEIILADENTEFNLGEDYMCWWIPADWDSYEHLYNSTKISEIDALSKVDTTLNTCTVVENAVHTPFTIQMHDSLYISIHEANLSNYASMTLMVDTVELNLKSSLVKSERMGYAVKRTLPFETPWRLIQIGEKPGDLLESRILLNLNEPNALGIVNWIKPKKYNGIWWEMHLNKSSWDMESGRHGATTENTKRYIDFASKNNLGGVLVEGWNTGWDKWITAKDREKVFDFVTPYADYDLPELATYARSKGVELIMHHETSAAPRTYEKQLDTAYRLMQHYGISSAKLGYVGKIIPDGEHHHGQWMVNHYRKVLEKAAQYKIAINVHEPIKQTGLRRTYPNLIAAEGVRGQEFNAWASDGGNPPEHLTIVPFTRMLAGPIDYTPGIFNIKLDPYKENNQVNTTLAHQLALYVVIYSPVQMAADLPEHYINHPAFEFIKDVGVDWEESHVLDAEIGEYVIIARKERNTNNWFLGAITDENARNVSIDCNFLDNDMEYKAIIYSDAPDSHWDANPTTYNIEYKTLNHNSSLSLGLVPGGGTAISFKPLTD